MVAGRPTNYQVTYAKQAEKLVKLGMTDAEIAQFFEVAPVTLWRWKNDHPKFCSSMARHKDEADEVVVQSLFKRAVGYSYDAVKIFMPGGADAPVYAPYVEHVPPDTNAARLWLTNRRAKDWKDRIMHSNDPDSPIVPVLNVTVKSE